MITPSTFVGSKFSRMGWFRSNGNNCPMWERKLTKLGRIYRARFYRVRAYGELIINWQQLSSHQLTNRFGDFDELNLGA
jgi:hypothetical protein